MLLAISAVVVHCKRNGMSTALPYVTNKSLPKYKINEQFFCKLQRFSCLGEICVRDLLNHHFAIRNQQRIFIFLHFEQVTPVTRIFPSDQNF